MLKVPLITKWLYRLRILPRWMIVFIDLWFILLSCVIGYLLRFNFSVNTILTYHFLFGVLFYLTCGLFSILVTNSYKGIIRYTGLQDGVRIFYMVTLNLVLACAVNLIYNNNGRGNLIPYSVICIAFLASFLFLFNYRLLVKYCFSYYKKRMIKTSNVLIFGTGQTGLITKHVIDATHNTKVVGFLEDDEYRVGKVIDGAKIFNANGEALEEILDDYSIDEVVITIKHLSVERKNEIVDICLRNHVRVRMVPPADKWVKGELSLNQIKEINIEDLLGREVIQLNDRHVEEDIRGKRVCVTGAAGSIGSELVRQLATYNPECIVMIDQAESPLYQLEQDIRSLGKRVRLFPYLADITNEGRIQAIFTERKPDVIFHAAAYKHVPVMESNPSEAVICNVLGTKIVADLAVAFKVKKFVMISTDKAVNPTNVMGCSKRIAEIYVQSLNAHLERTSQDHTLFITTRFGNVLGSNGSVIPMFKRQIETGGPVTVTHPEITRFFMTIPEACQLVLEAGAMGKGGEIFIFDMGRSIKIVDLAKKMILLSGFQPGKDIEIVFTGLREGEKLYEELLNNKENTTETHHKKIMIAKIQEYSYKEIDNYIDLFHDLINDRNELKMVALMKELVPEFKSNYSRYEVLDNKES